MVAEIRHLQGQVPFASFAFQTETVARPTGVVRPPENTIILGVDSKTPYQKLPSNPLIDLHHREFDPSLSGGQEKYVDSTFGTMLPEARGSVGKNVDIRV